MTTGIGAQDDWIGRARTRLAGELEAHQTRLAELENDGSEAGELHNRDALVYAARQQMEQVSAALDRIAQNRYGVCEGCNGPIPRERLEILPHARFCVPCQQKQS